MHRLLFLLTLVASPLFAAGEGPDIFEIYDRFLISNAAALECAQPDEETRARFLVNLQIMTAYVAQGLEERFPDRNKTEIFRAISERNKALTESARAGVRQKGCSHPEVKTLLEYFHFHAKWQPLGSSRGQDEAAE